MVITMISDAIKIPLAKFSLLFLNPRKNKGKLTRAPKLISPPNFFCLKSKIKESSMFPSERNKMIKIIILRLAKKAATIPLVNSLIFKIPCI